MREGMLITAIIAALTVGAATSARADSSFWAGALGAGLGGLLGSQFGRGDGQLAATGLGVATGALIGSSIGEDMDRADRAPAGYGYAPYSYYSPMVRYEPNYVAPPEVQVHTVYVQQPVYVTEGYVGAPGYYAPPPAQQECREYTQKVKIGGKIRNAHGVACLQPDGTWEIQK